MRQVATAAELVVRDTGVGIAPKDLPHVFERFYRADPARGRDPGGTGLGLSIAQWVAERHGGQISIVSDPGTGTTMTVRLPALGTMELPAGSLSTAATPPVPARAAS